MTAFSKIIGPVPMSVCAGANAQALLVIPPILAQIQVLIFGAFGLGPLKLDLVAQFKAAVGITIAFGDPLSALKAAIQAALQVVASLKAALVIGIPPLSIQVSASLALIASLAIKIGGINLAIDLALQVKLPAINLVAQLQAALSLGGLVMYAWSAQNMQTTQAQIAGYNFAADGFLPINQTYGMMLATAAPGASASFKFLFNPLLP